MKRRLSRRSFLARVAGSAVIAAGAFSTGCAHDNRTGLTDLDPTDRPDHGRTGVGLNDHDRGPNSDFRPPARPGRRRRQYTGGTDRDPVSVGDAAGYGRTGLTDTDPGDAANYGYGPLQGACPSGFERYGTDADAGPGSDPSGRCVMVTRRGRRRGKGGDTT